MTRTFAILANPITHVRSPQIHNAAFKAAKLDAVYVPLQCTADDMPGLLVGIARAGGGGNVTIPHKGLAAETVEKPSARVRATRACNTFWGSRGRVYGDNTDVIGFTKAVEQVVPDLKGAHVLVVGAGGGARAVLYALLEQGCDAVTILARNQKHRREVEFVSGRKARRVSYVTDLKILREEGYDLVVNATPLGIRDEDKLPFQLNVLGGVTAVYDIVYRVGGTAFVRYARSLGIPAEDGYEMLIQQAAAAFELWFETDAPINAMRRAFAMETPQI